MLSKFLLFPYYLTLKIRNRLYDSGKIKSTSYSVPIICIGNIAAGGTGKTPMVELIIRMLADECKVAVLSRGYRRRTEGFRLVSTTDTAMDCGDEPLQIKRKFPDITVAVDKERTNGVEKLMSLPEESRPDIILLDDAMQYRKLVPTRTVALIDYNRPSFKDELIPLGRLRDLPEQLRRASSVILTKAPEYINEWDIQQARQVNRLRPEQDLYFTKLEYRAPKAVFEGVGDNRYIYSKEVFLFSGIADDRLIIFHLSETYQWIARRRYPDHHYFNKFDIASLRRFAAKHPRALLLTTEKDAQRLLHCSEALGPEVCHRLFYLPVEAMFLTWDQYFKFKESLLNCIKGSADEQPQAAPQEEPQAAPAAEVEEVQELQQPEAEPQIEQESETEPEETEEKPDYLKPMEPVNGGLLF